jgi:hypothetical protein
MQKNTIRSIAVRFRRFSRKSYAVFCSLRKEISIGFLSADTNNCSLKSLKRRLQSKSPAFVAENDILQPATGTLQPLDSTTNDNLTAKLLQVIHICSQSVRENRDRVYYKNRSIRLLICFYRSKGFFLKINI